MNVLTISGNTQNFILQRQVLKTPWQAIFEFTQIIDWQQEHLDWCNIKVCEDLASSDLEETQVIHLSCEEFIYLERIIFKNQKNDTINALYLERLKNNDLELSLIHDNSLASIRIKEFLQALNINYSYKNYSYRDAPFYSEMDISAFTITGRHIVEKFLDVLASNGQIKPDILDLIKDPSASFMKSFSKQLIVEDKATKTFDTNEILSLPEQIAAWQGILREVSFFKEK